MQPTPPKDPTSRASLATGSPSHAERGEEPSRLTERTLVVAGSTALSRVLGYVRDSALGALLGSSPTYSALRLAFNIPNFARRLLGEGALTAAFLPMFSRVHRAEGADAARGLVAVVGGAQLAVLSLLAMAGLATCLLLPPSAIASILLEEPERAPLLLRYLAILIPYVVPVCLYAFAMAILNARGRFFLPAIAPFLQNVVALASFVVAWGVAADFRDPRGLGPAELDRAARIVAVGFLLGGVAMFLLQVPALTAERMLTWPRVRVSHPAFREFLGRFLPVALSIGVVQVSVLAAGFLAFAILGDGGNVHLDYAARIFQLPQGLVGAAVATAAFPQLARSWDAGRLDEVSTELRRALGLATILGAPAAAGLLVLALPTTTVLYGYGAFDARACAETANALVAFSLSIPFLTAVPVLARIYFAAGDTKTPSLIALGLVAFDLSAAYVFGRTFGVAGIASATTVTAVLNCGLLVLLLRRHRIPSLGDFRGRLVRLLVVGVACGVAAWVARLAAERVLEGFALPPRLLVAATLVAGIVAGFGAVVLAARLLGLDELAQVWAVLRQRRRGARGRDSA